MHTETKEDCIDVHMHGFQWPPYTPSLDTVTSLRKHLVYFIPTVMV